MGIKEKSVYVKVFIDKKKNKVMFAEAEEDFVDILFSFFTLPLGTIARLSSTYSDLQVGSLSTSLYESVANLKVKHFTGEPCKDALLNSRHSSASVLQKLKVNLDETNPIGATSVGDIGVFVKDKSSFIITDDLNVLPVLPNTSIILLNSLGLRNVDLLEERIMRFGVEEFSNLLNWSLVTNNPLTNLVFGGTTLCSCSCLCSLCIANSTLRSSTLNLKNSNFQPDQTIKLIVQKSKMIVLCAEVGNFFVELLFSFLTTPLGTVKCLTMDNSSPVAINNLYDSITSLGDGKYLKSEDVKTMLLCPKVDAYYPRVTDFLPIYEPNAQPGKFLEYQETFIVSDDLKVTVSAATSIVSVLDTIGIPDTEVVEVSIGEQEAIMILKASLTSTSVLTDCLNAFTKKGTIESPS